MLSAARRKKTAAKISRKAIAAKNARDVNRFLVSEFLVSVVSCCQL
jgi:hypothetical protein